MNKIQLSFTPQETEILATRAGRLGYSIPKYLKLLIGREVLSDMEEMSPKFLALAEEAQRYHAEGKGTLFKDSKSLMDYLSKLK
jgi:hypothetical protein